MHAVIYMHAVKNMECSTGVDRQWRISLFDVTAIDILLVSLCVCVCGKGRQGSDIGKKRQHPGAVQRVLSHAKQSGDRLRILALYSIVHALARLVPFIYHQ